MNFFGGRTESGGSIKRFNKTHSSQIENIAAHIDKLQDIKIFNVENGELYISISSF